MDVFKSVSEPKRGCFVRFLGENSRRQLCPEVEGQQSVVDVCK